MMDKAKHTYDKSGISDAEVPAPAQWHPWNTRQTLSVSLPPAVCLEHVLLIAPSNPDYQFMVAYHHSAGRYTYQICTTVAQEVDGRPHYHPISMMEGEIVPDSHDGRLSRMTLQGHGQQVPLSLASRIGGPIVLLGVGLLSALILNQALDSLLIGMVSTGFALVWFMMKSVRRIDARGLAEIREHLLNIQAMSFQIQDTSIFMSANDYARQLQNQTIR